MLPAGCSALVDTFLEMHGNVATNPDVSAAAMLFFLHVPRTAGRTYHACFLKVRRLDLLRTSKV